MHAAFGTSRAAFTTLARSCTGAKPELAAAALRHLRRFVKPSLGGKAFETEPPIVFFPLDPKKRHHESQNWRSFDFAVSQALLALACCVQDAGKIGSGIAKFDGSE